MKKLFALMIVMFLLVGVVSVYGQEYVFVPGTKEPTQPGAPSPKPSLGEREQLETVNVVVDYDGGNDKDPGEPVIKMPAIFYENIILGLGGTFDAQGNFKDGEGNVWSGFGTSTYTGTYDKKTKGVFTYGRTGYTYMHYENGKPTYFNGRDSEGNHFTNIPAGFIDKININAPDFSYFQGEFTYNGIKADIVGNILREMVTDPEDPSMITAISCTALLADGGVATLDADGNLEIRDADGNYVGGFSDGMADLALSRFIEYDEQYRIVSIFIPSDPTEGGASTLYKRDPETGYEEKIVLSLNGDVEHRYLEDGKLYSRDIQHANGDTTTTYFSEGKLWYDERVSREGWLVSWKSHSTGIVYVANPDQTITVHYPDGTSHTWTEEEAEKSTNKDLVEFQKENEWNRFYTGRGAVSAFIGKYIMSWEDYSALSSALFRGKDWLNYMEDVDKIFSGWLNTEYWYSEICRANFHRDLGDLDSIVVETPIGLLQAIAHVEAERSEPLPKECPCGSDETCKGNICYKGDQMQYEYFYKVTYGVRAPDDIKLTPDKEPGSITAVTFSIMMTGPSVSNYLFVYEGTSVAYFYDLENGESANAVGASAVVFYSSNVYDQICIIFGKRPLDAMRGKVDDFCVPLPKSQSSYLNWEVSVDTGVSDTPGEGDVPSAGPEINPNI